MASRHPAGLETTPALVSSASHERAASARNQSKLPAEFTAGALDVERPGFVQRDKSGSLEVRTHEREFLSGDDEVGIQRKDGPHIGVYRQATDHTVAAVPLVSCGVRRV